MLYLNYIKIILLIVIFIICPYLTEAQDTPPKITIDLSTNCSSQDLSSITSIGDFDIIINSANPTISVKFIPKNSDNDTTILSATDIEGAGLLENQTITIRIYEDGTVPFGGSISFPFQLQILEGGKVLNILDENCESAESNPNLSLDIARHIFPVKDALDLSSAFENNNEVLIEILEKYVSDSLSGNRNEQLKKLKKEFSDNPFIKKYLEEVDFDKSEKVKLEELADIYAGILGSDLLNPAIDALSVFIANRFKQEFAIAFFDDFKQKIDTLDTMRAFFPSTHTLLSTMEPYDFNTYLESMRQSFHSDLKRVDVNLLKYLKEEKESDKIKDETKYLMAVSSLELIQGIKDADDPADLIESLPKLTLSQVNNETDFVNALKLTALLSKNLRESENSPWVSINDLKKFRNTQTLELFLGLIYEHEEKQLKQIKINGIYIYDLLEKGSEKTVEFRNYVDNFTQTIIKIERQLSKLNTLQENSDSNQLNLADFQGYFHSTLQILELATELSDLTGENTNTLNDIVDISNKAFLIIESIGEKNYSTALIYSVDLMKDFSDENNSSEAYQNVIKYGSFMTSFIQAENRDDMVAILDRATLPVGSYRIKRQSNFSVSLNTYPGIFGGAEWLNRNKNELAGPKIGGNLGFTAPIGLSLIKGKLGKSDKHSFGLFISLIDLGGPVSFRLGDEDNGLPEFEIENFVAPGIFLTYGFKDKPYTLSAGAQHGPEIRKIEVSEGGQTSAPTFSSAFRFGVSLTIDIPLLTIYKN